MECKSDYICICHPNISVLSIYVDDVVTIHRKFAVNLITNFKPVLNSVRSWVSYLCDSAASTDRFGLCGFVCTQPSLCPARKFIPSSPCVYSVSHLEGRILTPFLPSGGLARLREKSSTRCSSERINSANCKNQSLSRESV